MTLYSIYSPNNAQRMIPYCLNRNKRPLGYIPKITNHVKNQKIGQSRYLIINIKYNILTSMHLLTV